jgi:hypothetical protein
MRIDIGVADPSIAEQVLLQRLPVFAGSFDLASEAVGGSGADGH